MTSTKTLKVRLWYQEKKLKDPKYHYEYKQKMKFYYKKRIEELKKNPEMYAEYKKRNAEKRRKLLQTTREDPEKYRHFLKQQRTWGRNALNKMTSTEKYEMWKRSRIKYRSTEKGILKRKEYKQSEKSKAMDKAYQDSKKDDPIFQAKRKKYYEENKEKNRPKRNAYMRIKRNTDILFRLISSMRSRMNLYIKKSGFNKNTRTFKLIGCSPKELKKHLEKQFRPGMSWANHGSWHIDHMKPLSSAKSFEEMNLLFHYSNLQPLWAKDNLRKSNKIINYFNFKETSSTARLL